MVSADHLYNRKRGGVCIYYKELLLLRIINVNYLNEHLRFEFKIGDEICSFISFYISLRQTQDKFETFTGNLELNLDLAQTVIIRLPLLMQNLT